ncbi:MAG: hypothetical protein MZV64_10810 [Ignavibacteriales bacterium]|nr:hypothetical protein [Ignavibacteriales bacterium]
MTASLVLWLDGLGRRLHRPLQPPAPALDPRSAGRLPGASGPSCPSSAAYVCLLWALATRSRFRFGATTLGLFVAYGVLGMIASVALFARTSPRRSTGAPAYLAPAPRGLVRHRAAGAPAHPQEHPAPERRDRRLVLLLAVLPEAVRFGFGRSTRFEIYTMPFGLGEVRANGVGRYALIVLIVAGVSLATSASKKRLPVAAGRPSRPCSSSCRPSPARPCSAWPWPACSSSSSGASTCASSSPGRWRPTPSGPPA